ncbi:MAG: ABC transporter permease [Nitrososphaerota archaeon]
MLSLTVQVGTVYLLASLGEIYAERSGILNLGLEGIMVMGAAISFIFTLAYGHLAAILASIIVGILMSLILAVMAIYMRLNQTVTGLALTMFGLGLSGFLASPEIRRIILLALNPSLPENLLAIQEAPKLPEIPVPGLSEIPVIGCFFRQNVLVYISYMAAPLMWFILFKTKPGLSLRSVGENPAAADAMGINVFKLRCAATMISGGFAGLAGAYLFLGFQPFWQEGLTAGKGFIALSLVILSTWNPLKAILGAYLFGGVEVIQYRLQLFGLGALSPYLLAMLPYLVAIVALIAVSIESVRKRIGVPASLGIPYSREE